MEKQPPFEFHPVSTETKLSIPFVNGIKSADLQYIDSADMLPTVDLNTEFMKHPESSYYIKIVGDSMKDEGLDEGDWLVVDRSLFPTKKALTICKYKGEFMMKHIVQTDRCIVLTSDNPQKPPIEVTENDDLCVCGVVMYVMKKKV